MDVIRIERNRERRWVVMNPQRDLTQLLKPPEHFVNDVFIQGKILYKAVSFRAGLRGDWQVSTMISVGSAVAQI